MQVLLIEPDEATRCRLESALARCGCQVEAVATLDAALARQDWSLVGAAVLGPGLSLEMMQAARERLQDRGGDTTLVLTTADMERAAGLGLTCCESGSGLQDRQLAEIVIDTAQVIVLVLDPQGRIVRLNHFMEQLSGYAQDEVVGQDWFETFLPQREQARVRQVFQQTLRDGAIAGNVNPIVTRSGQERQIRWWARTLRDASGRNSCVVAVGHDVTEQIEAGRRLVEQARLAGIGQTVTGLANESRNAFQRSQACLEVLAMELEGQTEALELVHRTQRALDHLYHLYEEVHNYASPIQLDRQPCDLGHVWRDAWARLEVMRQDKQVQLFEVIEEDVSLECEADWFALGQVFRNILDNAITACGSAGTVTVRCRKAQLDERPAIEVSIRDSGAGFAPEARDQAFDAFFTTKTRGTGLGLAVAKRIVEAHGGTIALGQPASGAELIITLPRN